MVIAEGSVYTNMQTTYHDTDWNSMSIFRNYFDVIQKIN